MPFRSLLVSVADATKERLRKMLAHELHAKRHSLAVKTTRDRDRGGAIEIEWHGKPLEVCCSPSVDGTIQGLFRHLVSGADSRGTGEDIDAKKSSSKHPIALVSHVRGLGILRARDGRASVEPLLKVRTVISSA